MQDLDSRLSLVTDPEAEPADLDESLAQFLLKYVRNEKDRCPAEQRSSVLPPPVKKESSDDP